MKSLALTVTLLLAVSVVECSRILVAAPLGTKSHQNVFGPLMKELAGRGHHLTLITNYRSKALEQISNIDQIEIEAMQIKPSLWAPLFNHSAMIDKNDFNYIFFKVFENIYTVHASREWAENMTVFTYEHPQVIQLLETSTFDMVLVSQVYATSMYPLAWHFNASLAIFNVVRAIKVSNHSAPFYIFNFKKYFTTFRTIFTLDFQDYLVKRIIRSTFHIQP